MAESEAHSQIERMLESELFRASEPQRRLLKYLANKSIAGDADQLKEYTIGVEALGKPGSYDPRHDSSVRLQTSKLRQKIIEYYLTEGQADPVHIDFPRGRFKLIFTSRESVPSAAPSVERASKWGRTTIALGIALAIAVCLCIYLGIAAAKWRRAATNSGAALWQPALEEFWSPFLNSSIPTVVCVGAPMFLMLRPGSLILRSPGINTWEEAENSGLVDKLKGAFPGRSPQEWYVFTGLGEADGAFRLGQLLAPRNLKMHFVNSTVLTWNDIGTNNVIFVGPPKFNLQVRDLPVVQDLVDDAQGIRNLRPNPGEPSFFEEGTFDPQNGTGETHALISRLPGLHGNGEILVVAGTATAGTLAATQFVTSEVYTRDLLRRIRMPNGKIPPYFQAVIFAKVKKWTPVEISCVAHHVLDAR